MNELSFEGNFSTISIEDLRRTLNFLKNYQSRQTIELEKLFSKYGKIDPIPITAPKTPTTETPKTPTIEVTSSNTEFSSKLKNFKFPLYIYNWKLMKPLLTSYDLRRQEVKNDLISLKKRHSTISAKIAEITAENKELENLLSDGIDGKKNRNLRNSTDFDSIQNSPSNTSESQELKEMEHEIRLLKEENSLFVNEISELKSLVKHVKDEQKSLMSNSELLPTHNSMELKEVLKVVKKKLLMAEKEKSILIEKVNFEKKKYIMVQKRILKLKNDIKLKEDIKNNEKQKKMNEKNELLKNIKLQGRDIEKLKRERDEKAEKIKEVENECISIQNEELKVLKKLKEVSEKIFSRKNKIFNKKCEIEKKKNFLARCEEEILARKKKMAEKSKKKIAKLKPKYENKMTLIRNRIDKMNSEIISESEKLKNLIISKENISNEFFGRLNQIKEQQKKPPGVLASLTSKISMLYSEKDEIEDKILKYQNKYREKQILNEKKITEKGIKINSVKEKVINIEKIIGKTNLEYENVVNSIKEHSEKLKYLQIEYEKEIIKGKEEIENVKFEKKKREIELKKREKNLVEKLEFLINEKKKLNSKLKNIKNSSKNGIQKQIDSIQLRINENEEENDMLIQRNNELKEKLNSILREKRIFESSYEDFKDYKNKLQKQLIMSNERARRTGVKIKELLMKEENLLRKKKNLVISIQKKKIEIERNNRNDFEIPDL